jgi:hypothetical protein
VLWWRRQVRSKGARTPCSFPRVSWYCWYLHGGHHRRFLGHVPETPTKSCTLPEKKCVQTYFRYTVGGPAGLSARVRAEFMNL